MEKIASDLKVSELKQTSLGNAYETLHSQASSMLVFSIKWKDLAEHFDSTRNAIRTRLQELQEREKLVEVKESNLMSEMESKKDDLCGIQKLIDEKIQVVIDVKRSIVVKEKEHSLIERRIQERTKKLNWIERSIADKLKEVECKDKELNKYREDIKLKVEQLSVILGAIEQRKDELDLKEKEIKAAEIEIEECDTRMKSKEERLNWIEKSMAENSKLANSKEEEVRVIQGSLNVYRESIKSKESELDAILKSIAGKKKEFDVKEEQIKTAQRLIQGCEQELKLKGEKLKAEEYSLRNKPIMEEWSCKLEFKEREVELKNKHVELKMEEFKKWVEERGKDLNSLSSELNNKEMQLERQAKELELTKKQCGVGDQVKIGPLEKTPANNAIVSSSASDKSNINISDGRSLQLFMYEHRKRNDSMSNKISSFLEQESSEPAKLVLEGMQGFHPSNLSVENKEFDLVLVRRTCILLLEELKRASPKINPEVREEAMELASDWKAKMKVGSENWLEILGFLRLVTTYELTSAYDGNELQSLLEIVAQHEQASELSRALLGNTDNPPANSNICSTVKIEKPESLVAKNEATFSSPNLQLSATTTDAKHLQGFQNQQFGEACESALKSIIYALIGKKRLKEAVGLIYTLKLLDKFPPGQIIKEYVDNGKKWCRIRIKRKKTLDEKDKITDLHIADLRVVIQCIKDYNLESECPPEDIESQIAVLELLKERRRLASSCLVLKVEQQEQLQVLKDSNVELQEQQEQKVSQQEQQVQKDSNVELQEQQEQKVSQQEQQVQKDSKVKQQQKKGNKRSTRFDHQQHQRKNKFQRTSILADRPCELPPDCPEYPNRSSSSWTHENYKYHGHFGTAANNYEIHANYGHPVQFGIPANRTNYGYGGHSFGIHQSHPCPPGS